jgi:hypothetical protein
VGLGSAACVYLAVRFSITYLSRKLALAVPGSTAHWVIDGFWGLGHLTPLLPVPHATKASLHLRQPVLLTRILCPHGLLQPFLCSMSSAQKYLLTCLQLKYKLDQPLPGPGKSCQDSREGAIKRNKKNVDFLLQIAI